MQLLMALVAAGTIAVAGVARADEAVNATITTDPALHALLPAKVRESGVITLATDAHHAPCDFLMEDNKTFTGWEEDYRQALAKKLGITIKPVSIAFDGLIAGVQSGRYDLAMKCISDTPVREQQVDFVDMSLSSNGVYALATSNVTEDPKSLCGLRAGSQTGTTYGQTVSNVLSPYCEKNGLKPIEKLEFGSQDATVLALLSGRVDFLVNDVSSAKYIRYNSTKELKVLVPDIIEKWVNGIVVQKGNDELSKALLAGAQAILADGSYDKIMEKWDLKPLILREPGINIKGKQAAN
ncbi:MAG TPA: ABC transporter substrate-binding protein [Paenirhodobacter sp.]